MSQSSVDFTPIERALISVSDKTGLEPLCRALHARGVSLYSTGGTYSYLTEQLRLPALKVETLTDFPEIMNGRVKTLHPKVFGGILARREAPDDLAQANQMGIPLFELVVVNLYPFGSHRGKPVKEQVAFVDIGGPAMLRAAAKNHVAVTVLSDPADYPEFQTHFESESGGTRSAYRFAQAVKTFRRTCDYDAAIVCEWAKTPADAASGKLPTSLSLEPQTVLRYGENPHQIAAWTGQARWKMLQGKELSYNNLLDAEAALRLTADFTEPTLAIIKHGNPCGAASGTLAFEELFTRALACDSKSAFGGIVSLNGCVNAKTAEALASLFLEVVIAKSFDSTALEILGKKKNVRLIEWADPAPVGFEVRPSLGGWLVQQSDEPSSPADLKTVTKTPLPASSLDDVTFAWTVSKHVRSNAIVLAKSGATIGIGAGQMSRVDAVQIALQKAGEKSRGSVLASDAFFPFRDNIDLLKDSGLIAIVQPGGSQRDAEVIAACDEHGIAMVFTGIRHFRH